MDREVEKSGRRLLRDDGGLDHSISCMCAGVGRLRWGSGYFQDSEAL